MAGTRLSVSPRLARRLAWGAITAQPLFVAAWVLAGALEPGYSHLDQTFSELGARNAAHPALTNGAYVLFGLSLAGLGPALAAVLPRRRATAVAAGLFGVAGLALVAVALLPLDCGLTVDRRCIDAWEAGDLSWRTSAHLWAALVFDAAFVLTPFVVARALWPRHSALPAILAAGTAVPILAFALFAGELVGAGDGLGQRLGFLGVHAWVLLVAAGILSTTRPAPAPGPLIPMRPRAFFGRAWSGRGELAFWPPGLWPGRGFDFRREITWASDEVWLVRDTVRFDDGDVEVRDFVARLAGPERVHITGDNLPGGADMLLSEDGYRMTPYRFAVPVGPLTFALRARDEVRPAGADGTLEWTIRFSWLGLPAARLRGHVKAGPT
jgi:hypothetical protein